MEYKQLTFYDISPEWARLAEYFDDTHRRMTEMKRQEKPMIQTNLKVASIFSSGVNYTCMGM